MGSPEKPSETVAEIAKKVIGRTVKLSIPLTPENYCVWFEYFRGTNEQLTEAIDALIVSDNRFTAEINERLYSDHIESNSKKILTEVHRETRKILQHIFKATLSTNGLTSDFAGKMKAYYHKLNDTIDLDQIQLIIEDIILDTNRLASSSIRLSHELKEATSRIENLTRQLEETKKELLLDPLTGLNNRKAFDRKIAEFCEQFYKKEGFFSVAITDIDYFKKFNDRYGHQIGDEVLVIVGANLKENLKGKDFLSRYGGEEFVILLPNTRLDKAHIVLDQIRDSMAKRRLKLKKNGEPLGRITISAGISEIHEGDDADSVVGRADAALYMAKNAGRNNVKTEKDLA